YLNRPELTAERFVQDRFSVDPEARLYKSGDLGRWRADGNIDYAGRNDQQVKLRGQRIELGEIESRLAAHPAVREAVVIAREDEPGEKRLVAYVTVTSGSIGAEELRAHLLARVPQYMVPSAFVQLEAFPLTPTNKIDRKALPKPEAYAYASNAYEAPQGELEARLASVWQDLLHVERVGRHDNFFELGGHSLLATQLISKIRTQLNVELPLKALFEGGTVAQLAQAIATAERNAIPAIVPVDRSQMDRLPLSFAQERLWFLNELEPNSAGYNVPGAVTIRGALDVQQLEAALNLIVARHETLRTVFPSEGGRARQRILTHVDFALERFDLSSLADATTRESEARALCLADATAPFDLANGPLLRGKVIRLADDEHVLMMNMHHIISDGWSVGVLIRELGLVMEAFREGRTPALPPLAIQYVDYSVWQRRLLEEGGVLEQQLAYWRQKLAGVPESLDLPTDHPRPSVQTFAGATKSFALDAQLTARLKRLADEQGGTLYMVLLAAFNALMYRYTGQEDICIGTPIANRQYGETEGLIGMFVNTLALRTQIEAGDAFNTLLARVKTTCLEAYQHQDAPFEKVIDALHVQRNLAISPLFQVMLILQNTDRAVADASISLFPLDSGIGKFDLSVEFAETGDGLSGSIRYRTALYEPETIERMIAHFTALCRAITATPGAAIAHLQYLGETETQTLLVDFNATAADYPRDKGVPQLFAEQVALIPDAAAVTFGEQSMTYAELDRRSAELARHLRARGVGPDTLVGVHLDRSLDMVVALMAILRAGGAYLPLDPDSPSERLQFMLADAAPAVVLTQERLISAFPSTSTPLVALDDEREIARSVAEADDRDVVEAGPDHLAYVIYTSGSTGVPKGVMIERDSLTNYLTWITRYLAASGVQSLPAVTNLSFDASLKQIFGPLITGRTVVLVDSASADPEGLLRTLEGQEAPGLNCVPSLWRLLIDLIESGPAGRNRNLKALLLGGEEVSPELIGRSQRVIPGLQVTNLYGPTETTSNATFAGGISAGNVSIGRPVANTRIYILDAHGQPVPVGVIGEIHIGGAGVARGYLNRPQLTAERFIRDPFSAEPGARMYKSGDLGRWRADGTIEYVGRNDQQVKLRGQRIELGEIETQLARHPGVKEVVVIAREDEPGEKRLVAYLTYVSEPVELDELRAHLLARVPQYMVPAAFVELEALPLTPTRKIDRKALPKPEAQAYASKEYEAPQGEMEQALAAIWQELLHAPRVGRHDNFFELGGHSLLATQLISKIRTQLGVDLPLKTLFEDGTIARLAQMVAIAGKSEIPPIVPVDRSQYDRLPLSFAQERLWFLSELEPHSAGYNVPGAVTITGELDVDQLEKAFNLIIARHETLRTVFPSEGGQARQRILDGFDFALERFDLTHCDDRTAREEEARTLCLTDARTPFDLANGPLLRGRVIRMDEREHILMLNMHHIISDGWSIGVLIREIAAITEALRDGRQPALPPLPVQYVDYSIWQRRWLDEGGVLERQLAYWQQKLSGVAESLDLATDHPRPSVQTFTGATQSFALDVQLTARLKRLAEQQGGTLYMVLLAAFKALMYRYTGQNDICIGTPIANRQYGETEGLIGMFVNTLALRTEVEGNEPFLDLLAKVRTTCLEAYANQDAPFEKLVDMLHLERNLAISPLFQVMLILQNTERSAIDSSIAIYPLDSDVSKFDLSIEFTETADGLSGAIRYRTALYKAQTIARMVEHFTALCEAIIATPAAEVRELQYLRDAETQTLLVDYNDTHADYPAGLCLHDLFDEQAATRPDAIAAVAGDERLTYGELLERSHAVALYLQAEGVGPDTLVGVCMERSLDMLVAMLGILGAGGAYVPLDPAYPDDRIAYMLRDSGAGVVLTQQSLDEKLRALVSPATKLIALDAQWPRIEQRVAELKGPGIELRRD
ncbi:MAG TPA: amino acid adenylation domain-containing protein, partial [Thermoanaerobaculia bacterium]